MDKEYIESQYRYAVLTYAAAATENDRWEARRMMAGLEDLAMQLYGFDYCDQLHAEQLAQLPSELKLQD